MPSVALMYANATPSEATIVQLIVPWWLETSMPWGPARLTTGLAIVTAERADNTIRWVGSRMVIAKIGLADQRKQVRPNPQI